jgi:hypothetical protein
MRRRNTTVKKGFGTPTGVALDPMPSAFVNGRRHAIGCDQQDSHDMPAPHRHSADAVEQ